MPKDSRKLSLAQTLGILTVSALMLGTTSSLAQPLPSGGQSSRPNGTDAGRQTNASTTRPDASQAEPAAQTEESHALSGSAQLQATTIGDDPAKSPATIANNNALDHYDLAQYYISKFDFKMAELELEAAIMYVPTMKTAHRDYCLVSLLRGHPMRATAEFMMVVGLGEPIPLNESERQELTARGAKMHYRKGLEFGGKRQWDNAIVEFKWAQQYAPQNAAIVRSLAFSYASHGDFELAEATYARGFAMYPSDPYGHADFAYILSEHGQK